MDIVGMGFFFCLRFRRPFLSIQSFKILRFWIGFFLKTQILRCLRKMCWLFPCIPIFRRSSSTKKFKKMCMCVGVKITLLLVKSACFGVKKGICKFWPKNILFTWLEVSAFLDRTGELRLIFELSISLESPVKYLIKSGVKTTYILDWCYQSSLFEVVCTKND